MKALLIIPAIFAIVCLMLIVWCCLAIDHYDEDK